MKRQRITQAGVSLLEMLVVVTIIGIIAGIAIPNFMTMLANRRTRSSIMALLSEIRQVRSRAIGLNRELRMEIYADDATAPQRPYSYNVIRPPYTIYKPQSIAENNPEVLWSEPAENLEANVSFNVNQGIVKDPNDNKGLVLTVGGTEITSPARLDLQFNPSGTISILSGNGTLAMIELRGKYLVYNLSIYRGGQVSLSRPR